MDCVVNVDADWKAVRVHARRMGEEGPTTVFVHGWATTSQVWAPVLERWHTFTGTALAIDLPGVGWSSKPPTGYTIERWATALAQFIESLDGPVVLVGHSMGGLISQRAALLLGGRLQRLILVSPVPASGVPLPQAAVQGFEALAGTRAGMAQVLSSMMVTPPSGGGFDRLVDASASVSDAAYVEGLRAWTSASFAEELAALTVPTRVLCGAQEQPLSPDLLRNTVLRHIPGSTLATIPGVGHYPQLEDTDAFCDALDLALRA